MAGGKPSSFFMPSTSRSVMASQPRSVIFLPMASAYLTPFSMIASSQGFSNFQVSSTYFTPSAILSGSSVSSARTISSISYGSTSTPSWPRMELPSYCVPNSSISR